MTDRTKRLSDATEGTRGHTPGPWTFECGDHSHRYVHVTDADDRTVHYKYASAGPNEAARDEANGRLIAAAPELLEALQKCRALFSEIKGDFTDPREECREGWAIIDTAIAKATASPDTEGRGE